MIGAPVPGVVNALQVTIPGRSPSVPSVKALGNARDEKKGSSRRETSHLASVSIWLCYKTDIVSFKPFYSFV